MPVDEVSGDYGEFTVLVDDQPLVAGGPLVWMGLVPRVSEVIDRVRARLAGSTT